MAAVNKRVIYTAVSKEELNAGEETEPFLQPPVDQFDPQHLAAGCLGELHQAVNTLVWPHIVWSRQSC